MVKRIHLAPMLRKLKKQEEVAIPKEYKPLVKETASLFKGEKFKISIPEVGLIVSGHYYWEEGDKPWVEVKKVQFMPKLDKTFTAFIKEFNLKTTLLADMPYNDDEYLADRILKTSACKAFHKRIHAVIVLTDKLEQAVEGFDYEQDILIPAELYGR